MKPIFRTDLALIVLGSSSLITGILIHLSWHFAQHTEWHNWSVVHCVTNVALLITVGFHIKQHKGWFKNILKRSSLKAKMPIFVTLCSLATIGSGIYLLIFAKGEGKDVIAELDIDSKELNTFDDTDKQYLEAICQLLAQPCSNQ